MSPYKQFFCYNCFLVQDISQPLKHSFIHTGHADASGKRWGDPGQIDEYVHCWITNMQIQMSNADHNNRYFVVIMLYIILKLQVNSCDKIN